MVGVATIEPVLYLLAMGVGLGVVVDAATDTHEVLGTSYLLYIGPALLMSTMVTTGIVENSYTVMEGFRWQRCYLGAQATPIKPKQIAFGHLVGTSIRYLITLVLFLSVLYIFGAVKGYGGFALIPLGVLTACAMGLPMMAFSSYIRQDTGQFALVNRFIVIPMTLFSGTFFPLESLPEMVRPLGWASPLWHSVNLGRALATPLSTPEWLAAVNIGYLVALSVVGWIVARSNYCRRLSK